ncbi:MAG: CGNR zinc finger domain-containing protein [Anaerolineae bacterium]
MAETETPLFELIGGELCLDFTNTASWRDRDDPHVPIRNDRFKSYAVLLAWSEQAGALSAPVAAHLRSEAERRPADAAAVLVQAVALRETLYRVFSAYAAGVEPRAEDMVAMNDALGDALSHARIAYSDDSFAWGWANEEGALDRMLWPVVRSAAELLTSAKVERVHECEGDTCTWLFVDTSKNHSRRWCDMKDCGNRAKARRHYHRARTPS